MSAQLQFVITSYSIHYTKLYESALKIQKAFGAKVAQIFNLKNTTVEDMKPFSNLIFGTSAWGIGEMQDESYNFV